MHPTAKFNKLLKKTAFKLGSKLVSVLVRAPSSDLILSIIIINIILINFLLLKYQLTPYQKKEYKLSHV